MGAWGVGLYSNDFAMDLRATIGAVARLPFDGEKLVDILRETETAAADDPNNEDHTVFWLAVADQFAKRGISSGRARDKAVAIIDSGLDISTQAQLGMSSSDLKKRRKVLEDVRERILAAPSTSRERVVLKKPQDFILEVGDVFAYPVDNNGHCINPYFAKGDPHWSQSGWSAVVIVDRGLAFDYLAWYRPVTISRITTQRPALTELLGELVWILRPPGTCAPAHVGRMRLEKLGDLHVNGDKLRRAFSPIEPGTDAAVNDLSIANDLNIDESIRKWADFFRTRTKWLGFPRSNGSTTVPSIRRIQQILSS